MGGQGMEGGKGNKRLKKKNNTQYLDKKGFPGQQNE